MTELTEEQLVYLLYAKAYSRVAEGDTLTKSSVKTHLPDKWKKEAERVFSDLKAANLIELKDKAGKATQREGRFSLTHEGHQVLASNLVSTNYDFVSSKSYKVLNAVLVSLLPYFKEVAKTHNLTIPSSEMPFDKFEDKFKSLYFEERRQQELRGVVAINSQDLCQKFIKQNSISEEKLIQYFESLKTNGKILAEVEKGKELIQWVE